jgi:hypothetical protein
LPRKKRYLPPELKAGSKSKVWPSPRTVTSPLSSE